MSSDATPNAARKQSLREQIFGHAITLTAAGYAILLYQCSPSRRGGRCSSSRRSTWLAVVRPSSSIEAPQRTPRHGQLRSRRLCAPRVCHGSCRLPYEAAIAASGVLPEFLRRQWRHVLIGAAGAGASFFAWTHAMNRNADDNLQASQSEQKMKQVAARMRSSGHLRRRQPWAIPRCVHSRPASQHGSRSSSRGRKSEAQPAESSE